MNAARNPLLGHNRSAIFTAATRFAGRGTYVLDEGCPLTLWGDRSTVVAIVSRHAVIAVRVNVDTLVAQKDVA